MIFRYSKDIQIDDIQIDDIQIDDIQIIFRCGFTRFLPFLLLLVSPNAQEDDDGLSKSVHFLMLPQVNPACLNLEAETRMKSLQQVIEIGRICRERRNLSLKNPISKVIVVSANRQILSGLSDLTNYLKDELNMRDLEVTTDEEDWCVLHADLNLKLLGRKLGKSLKSVRSQVQSWSHAEIQACLTSGKVTLNGFEIVKDELVIAREFKGDKDTFEADVTYDGDVMVILDCREDHELQQQGVTREFINRVQKLRKKAGLLLQDKIHVYVDEPSTTSKPISAALAAFQPMIVAALGGVLPSPVEWKPAHAVVIISEACDFADSRMTITLTVPAISFASTTSSSCRLWQRVSPDPAFVSDVQTYVATMDYHEVKLELLRSKTMSLVLNAQNVELTLGQHLFLTPESHQQHVASELKQEQEPQAEKPAKKDLKTNLPLFASLDIRVGEITKVWHHPDSEKLFCEEIDVGEEAPKPIASGLRHFYTTEEMANRKVLVLCNLKPAKLGGFKSHGMVLCASNAAHDQVELIEPPAGAKVGERVFIATESGEPASAAQVKKQKIWERASVDFCTSGEKVAMYKDQVIQTSAGPCLAKSLTNVHIS